VWFPRSESAQIGAGAAKHACAAVPPALCYERSKKPVTKRLVLRLHYSPYPFADHVEGDHMSDYLRLPIAERVKHYRAQAAGARVQAASAAGTEQEAFVRCAQEWEQLARLAETGRSFKTSREE
jgi:hypothetical protein